MKDCMLDGFFSGWHQQLWLVPCIGLFHENWNNHGCGERHHIGTQWTWDGSGSTATKCGKHVVGIGKIFLKK